MLDAAALAGLPYVQPPAAPAAWPDLREELQLHAAGCNADGSPAWHIADPVRNQFFRIGWLEFEVLQRFALADAEQIAQHISRETTLAVEARDVTDFVGFLQQQGLLRQARAPGPSDRFGWRWWLHNYLFIRVPLVRPARQLAWLAPRLSALYSLWFAGLTVLAGVTGLALAARQWDQVTLGLARVFTLEGTLGYLGALALSKVIHELSHALTATRHGVRVGHMGLALVVMWPMAYTDTGESWKLSNARHRLAIASAGIAAELTLAAWCTLLWALLPDSGLRSAAFFLASTAWVWTLAINASPFMRFDGYFIVADLLDIPGLHERAGRFAKRWLHRTFLGLRAPLPEPVTPARERFLTAFALTTWVYRLVVFAGIAVVVYHAFFKALGLLLFAVEIWYFLARPVVAELHNWWRWRAAVKHRVWLVWLLLLGAGAACLLAPWPTRVEAPGVLRSAVEQAVYSPFPARLLRVDVQEGQAVAVAQRLAELDAPRQSAERERATAMMDAYGSAARGALGGDSEGPARQVMADQQRSRYVTEAQSRDAELKRLQLTALQAGQVRDVDPLLSPGGWINASTPLAWVVQAGHWQVEALVSESDRLRLAPGNAATVVVKGRTQVLQGRIRAIDDLRVQHLPHMLLAVSHGGSVATQPATRGAELRPVDGLYRVLVEGEGDQQAPAVRRVVVHLQATHESFGARWLQSGLSSLIQQSGF